MAYELRDFSDVAPQTTIGSDITNVSTTITVASGTGYPSGGAAGDFVIQIESELVRVSSRSGTSLTVSGGVAGRGINGTTAVGHVAGVNVNFVHSAILDAKEANYAVSKTVAKALASQTILVADAINSFTGLAIGANGTILQAIAGAVAYGSLPTNSVGSAQITDGSVGANELAAGAVVAGKIGVGGVSAANQLAPGIVDHAAILDGSITDTDVDALNKDGLAAVASMRTLGTGATQAAGGTDSRLSDTRTPTNATVTQAKFAAGVLPTTVQTTAPTGTTGLFWFDSDDMLVYVYNGTSWVCITPVSAVVTTSQTTSSTAYTNLATVGPTATITTGTQALVTVTANLTNDTISDGAGMSFAITGATTVAASDNFAYYINAVAGGQNFGGSATYLVTGLTAGVNVFTAKYRAVAGGTMTALRRHISVVAIP